MGRVKTGEPSRYMTPSGKKVIHINISPELDERITNVTLKMSLSRAAYTVLALNERLAKDELSHEQERNSQAR